MITLAAFADEADSSLAGQITALQRNHIPYIELRGINGKNIAHISVQEAEVYAAQLREGGIRVWSIGSPIGKVDMDDDFDAHLELLRHICRLGKIFDTHRIRMFSFFQAHGRTAEVMERMAAMVAVAEEMGMTLYHENEKDIYGDTLERTLELLEKVPGLRCIYDGANFLEVGEPAHRTLDALHGRTDYFHIKDVIAETGELVPAGYGDGNIPELVRRIGSADRTLTIEPHLAIFEGFAQIDSTRMKNKFHFTDNHESFDAAVKALKNILSAEGYHEEIGEVTVWKRD